MEETFHIKPHVRLVDGYEQRAEIGLMEPEILLTIGDCHVTLSGQNATALAIMLLDIQSAWRCYSDAVRRAVGLPSADSDEITVS